MINFNINNMITIVAEKPSVGKEIASFLGVVNSKDGYLEGNGYYVTWAYGHLFELKDFKEIGFDGKWNIDNLPFIPKEYQIKLKNDSGVKKQYRIISELFSKSNEIICATDAGREGELIFRYIYEFEWYYSGFEIADINCVRFQRLLPDDNLRSFIEGHS